MRRVRAGRGQGGVAEKETRSGVSCRSIPHLPNLGGERVWVLEFGQLAGTFELLLRPRLVVLVLGPHGFGERCARRRGAQRAFCTCALILILVGGVVATGLEYWQGWLPTPNPDSPRAAAWMVITLRALLNAAAIGLIVLLGALLWTLATQKDED